MKRVLLLQLDGKIPSLALMRLAGWCRSRGDAVTLQHARRPEAVERGLWDQWDEVYAGLIFTKTRSLADRVRQVFPGAVVGGTGWDLGRPARERMTLERLGVPPDQRPDYADYPAYPHSIGFTQRGCRLSCPFCDVPLAEGKVAEADGPAAIWRGEPWPRNLLLLDNDFFGQPGWRQRIEDIRAGGFRVSWNQGFNVRLIEEEHAAAIASLPYYDDQFKTHRLYTAWDNRKDEARLFRNLEALARHGVKPDDILVYMLVGFWDGPKLTGDDFYRQRRLREFGCRPYPMPYVRNDELRGFQRWVVGAYDKRVPWPEWERAGYDPRRLGLRVEPDLFAEEVPR